MHGRSEEPEAEDARRGILPRVPALLLRLLLPAAERAEVLGELAAEHEERASAAGRWAAWLWIWRQTLMSVPALIRRGWWRGWSGFEPRADRMNPGGAMFQSGAMDLRFALRRLRKRPTYAALTILTLSLGVAGTAAVYGIAQRLLLDPLPVRAEEELVVFWSGGSWSEAEFLHARPAMDGFEGVAAIRPGDATLDLGDAPTRLVPGISASAELFEVLGVDAMMGRGFRPGDDAVGAEPVAVISHALWQDLGSDPGIVGRPVELAGVPRTIVGVMPAGFWYPDPSVRLWLAEEMDPENHVGNYELVARMPPGTSIDAMGGQVERITRALGERFDYPDPQWDLTREARLTPLREDVIGPVKPSVLALLGAMAVILLVASVNVAALMLGQLDSRGGELAVRSALGAGRPRLVRQLVVESLVIGGLAGVLGAGLALLGFPVLVGALPLGALAETTAVDWTLFGAAMAIALAAATVVAMVPGFSVGRGDLQTWLARARTGGVAARGGRLEGALVVAQVALVVLVASGAALLIRSVANLRAVEPGVDVERVAVVEVLMPVSTDFDTRRRMVREMVEVAEALPGVVSAGSTQKLPLRFSGDNWGILVEDRPELSGTSTFFRIVTPGYLETMGIQVRSGRGFEESDRTVGDEGTVVINQALAERYFPGLDPLGRRIAYSNRWDRIVGVVEDVTEGGDLRSGSGPARYVLYDQLPGGGMLPGQTIVLRTGPGVDPASVLDPARRAIQAAAPGVAIRDLTTMENVFTRAIGPARQVMSLLTLLGALALVLGVIGVYGVVSHFVTRRKRDWGVRIALGMRPRRVVTKIVGRGGALVGSGIVLGLAAFVVLSRLLASFLYGVGTTDPLALVGTTALLMGAGLAAAYLPARRASRIDPARVLREQ